MTNKKLNSVFNALLLVCASAQAAQITAEALVNDAYADGGFIASATTCNLDAEEIKRFASQQEASALSIAKNNQLIFDSDNYNQYVTEGFESKMALYDLIKTDEATEIKNCVSVNKKLKNRLSQKRM